MKVMKTRTTLLIFMLMSVIVSFARDYSPSEIENPNVADRRVYVADPGNLVSAAVKSKVNQQLYDLRRQTSAEVAVAVVPSIGDMPIEDFAERLFTGWGLGKEDKDNGLLVVIALDQRKARIQTGYGVEGVIPDISARKIIDRSIIPYMKEGNLDGAVKAVTADIANVMTDPVAAEELKSDRREAWENRESPVGAEDFIGFAIGVALFLFLVSAGLLIFDIVNTRGSDRYHNAVVWQNHRLAYWLLAIFSMGMGLITAGIAEWMRWRARNKPLICQVCGTKMRKLNEEEDNGLLNSSQDFEEQLKTVDYDVWECPHCGSVERFPFRARQTKYTECPNCHTVAMCLVRDHTLQPATTRSEGVGEQVYECQFCHHQNKKRYRIPRKDDGAGAALAAGAILGSLGRGGGGGGFGGGFGGGSTGGGGASGGW